MPSARFPVRFSQADYIKWHEKSFPTDKPLLEKLNGLRDSLRGSSAANLSVLGQLLTQIAIHTEPEVKIQSNRLLGGNYNIPLESFDPNSEEYDSLFKTVDSILDKMWRSNRVSSRSVSLVNLAAVITDLVRTSVVSPTLLHAKEFARRLESWKDIVGEENVGKHFSTIRRIQVDPEAKPSSGYFAYHALVWFSGDYCIELQVYSQLTSAWRSVSHVVYERSRLGVTMVEEPGSTLARLVSLGHLLHIAECELDEIVGEMKNAIDR